MFLEWIKCDEGGWCSFFNVNLAHTHFDGMEGVYIIWRTDGKVVRIGQGVIKDRISSHRVDSLITNHNPAYVTWAQVPATSRDGIERFLADSLQPLVGSVFPDAFPIKVNLPE